MPSHSAMGLTTDQFRTLAPFSSLSLASSSASQSRISPVFDESATAPLVEQPKVTSVTVMVTVIGVLSSVPSLAVTVTVYVALVSSSSTAAVSIWPVSLTMSNEAASEPPSV